MTSFSAAPGHISFLNDEDTMKAMKLGMSTQTLIDQREASKRGLSLSEYRDRKLEIEMKEIEKKSASFVNKKPDRH